MPDQESHRNQTADRPLVRKSDLGWARGSTRWRVSVSGFLAPWFSWPR